MKNYCLLILCGFLLCGIFKVNAQTESGRALLGGETKLTFTSFNSKWKNDDDNGDSGKSIDLEFSPQVGFFIADGLALGAEIPITYSSEKDEDDTKYSTTSMAIAPFLRYYFDAGNVKPYLHGGIGLGSAILKYDSNWGSDEQTATMFLYEIGGGIAVFLNENVSIDIGVAYASASLKPSEDNDTNYREITSGLGVGIGLVVFL